MCSTPEMALRTLNQASGAVSTKGHAVAEFVHMRDDVMREKKLEHLSTARFSAVGPLGRCI